jgi:sugar lactone lactonase YvrE
MNPRCIVRSIVVFTLFVGGQAAFAQPYTWSNFAGSAGGLGHANATGTAAQFVYPAGVASDPSGNIYVADTGNQIIRKITAAGVTTTFAGTAGVTGTADGTGAAAQFNAPTGVAVDASGNVYVADAGNDTIRVITSLGVVTTLAGTPGVSGTANGIGENASFNGPTALTLDSAAMYVADTGNNTIRRVTYSGVVTTVAGTPGVSGTSDGTGPGALFNAPSGIAVAGTTSKYFIADTGNNTIRELTTAGVVTTYAGVAGVSGTSDGALGVALYNQPVGVLVDSKGRVYVGDSGNETIRRITSGVTSTFAGKAIRKGSTNAKGAAARFNDPNGITLAPNSDVYVADTGNSMVRTIDASGTVTTLAGSPTTPGSTSGTGAAALFNGPCGVALDGSNNVYIADTYNNTIRFATGSGVVTTIAGTAGVTGSANGSGTNAFFFHPKGIAVDANNIIYVADTSNDLIRKITPAGVVSTLAGKAGVSGTTDGVGAAALFNAPQGIAVDASGTVFVADTGNNTIRVVSAGGSVRTFTGLPGVSGTNDGTGSSALFNGPQSITVDGTNGIFVADTLNQTIRLVLSNGAVSTFAGRPGVRGSADGKGAARFSNPSGITVDNHHDLFVADTRNDTIRMIAQSGTVTTIGGTAGLLGSTSGTDGASEFAVPQGIAATHAGVVYVADTSNNRIAKGQPVVGSVTVTLAPAAAITAGAQWNVDGGFFMNSGATAGGLLSGTHSIGFKDLTAQGFVSPPPQTVNVTAFAVTSATGTYVQQFGSVNVTLLPAEAVTAGGLWNVDGGASQVSGTTVGGLSVGSHVINFTAATEYNTPPPVNFSVAANAMSQVTGTYVLQTGSVTVTLNPAGAITAGGLWNVDGGPSQGSGATVGGLTLGSHTINFLLATGYVTPPSQFVTVFNATNTVTAGNYGGIPVISVQQPAGTLLESNTSTIDFGAVVTGSSAQRQFEIIDIGTAPLTNLGVAITNAAGATFNATALATGSLAIGGSTTFIVTGEPYDFATHSAGLEITSSDPATPVFNVGLTITGTTGPVNLALAAGSFAGLLTGTDTSVRGYANVLLSKTGALTGRVIVDGILAAVKGSFSAGGQFTGKPANVPMTLTSGSGGPTNPAGYHIAGTALVTGGTLPFVAWHAAYVAKATVAESPRYTVLMDGTSGASNIPQGTGYGFLTVAKGGGATFSGKLADGTAFLFSGFITSGFEGHQLVVFDPKLYGNKGLFAGPITFETLPDSNCDGVMDWVRPGVKKGTLYPAGFATTLDLNGAVYAKPGKNIAPLPITSGTFILSDGGLPATFSNAATITTKDMVLVSGTNKIKVTLNVVTGGFSGSFDDPLGKKPVPFFGALYQNLASPGAGGFFIGPVTSGSAVSGDVNLVP